MSRALSIAELLERRGTAPAAPSSRAPSLPRTQWDNLLDMFATRDHPSPLDLPRPNLLPRLHHGLRRHQSLSKYDKIIVDRVNTGLFNSRRAQDLPLPANGAQRQEEPARARQEQVEQPAAHLDAIQQQSSAVDVVEAQEPIQDAIQQQSSAVDVAEAQEPTQDAIQQSSTVDVVEAQTPSQDDTGNASLTNAMGTSLSEGSATDPESHNSSTEDSESDASTISKDDNKPSIKSEESSEKFHPDRRSLDTCEENNCRTQPLQPGEVHDLLRGTKRKRQLHDDCERSSNAMYSRNWEKLSEMDDSQRGHVCGYEHGDDGYEFGEWMVKKKQRICEPRQIRDPISGMPRRRLMMDDKQGEDLENWISERWDRIRDQLTDGLEAEEKIWGYELGDLDLSWSQLKKARNSRLGWWL